MIWSIIFGLSSLDVGADVLTAGGAWSAGSPRRPSDMVVSRRVAGAKLAPHSAQKIVPSNCLDWQLLQTCIVSKQFAVDSVQQLADTCLLLAAYCRLD